MPGFPDTSIGCETLMVWTGFFPGRMVLDRAFVDLGGSVYGFRGWAFMVFCVWGGGAFVVFFLFFEAGGVYGFFWRLCFFFFWGVLWFSWPGATSQKSRNRNKQGKQVETTSRAFKRDTENVTNIQATSRVAKPCQKENSNGK